jgi:LmbE family N-acetylglucosaminyl deacetylase
VNADVCVCFSPHLDDVVLSCPAHVLAERTAGRRVIVATLFTEGGEDEDGRRLYALRRREDETAVALLGAEPLHLGLPDAPFRGPYYRSFRAIVLGEQAEGTHAAEAADCVRQTCLRLRPTRCYFPLGVGTHIDHRLVHRAVGGMPNEVELSFYEDRPYVFLPCNLRLRLQELGASVPAPPPADLRPVAAERLEEDLRRGLHETAYVRRYLSPGEEWEWCEAELVRRLSRPPKCDGPSLHPTLKRSNEQGLERICAAVGAYSSQVDDMLGGLDEFRRCCREYAARLQTQAPYAERCWQVAPTSQSV